jgi:hypothetical protein
MVPWKIAFSYYDETLGKDTVFKAPIGTPVYNEFWSGMLKDFTADPLNDSRFTSWPAGDTYQVYPGPLGSIRFEKLIEGIQDFEKIAILRKEYSSNNQTDKLRALEDALKTIDLKKLNAGNAGEMVAKVKKVINE